MPELDFEVTGVEAITRGLTPLFQFTLRITAAPPADAIQALLLNAQIQIQSPQRSYTADEKERLAELFGAPERWGQTLRNRFWTHASATVGAFTGVTEAVLAVPCTYDLNLASVKYFYALDGGDVSLLFLFSGSIFYARPQGGLQVERISWNKECVYRMPLEVWKGLMEEHYPNCSWLYLQRDVFERLWAHRRRNGLTSWEQTIEELLQNVPHKKADAQEALT